MFASILNTVHTLLPTCTTMVVQYGHTAYLYVHECYRRRLVMALGLTGLAAVLRASDTALA